MIPQCGNGRGIENAILTFYEMTTVFFSYYIMGRHFKYNYTIRSSIYLKWILKLPKSISYVSIKQSISSQSSQGYYPSQ